MIKIPRFGWFTHVYSPFLVVQYTFLLVFETAPCSFVKIPIFDLWIPDGLMLYSPLLQVFPCLHSPEFTMLVRHVQPFNPKKSIAEDCPTQKKGVPPSSGASQVKFSMEGDGSSCSCSTAAGATGRVQTWLTPASAMRNATASDQEKFGTKWGKCGKWGKFLKWTEFTLWRIWIENWESKKGKAPGILHGQNWPMVSVKPCLHALFAEGTNSQSVHACHHEAVSRSPRPRHGLEDMGVANTNHMNANDTASIGGDTPIFIAQYWGSSLCRQVLLQHSHIYIYDVERPSFIGQWKTII